MSGNRKCVVLFMSWMCNSSVRVKYNMRLIFFPTLISDVLFYWNHAHAQNTVAFSVLPVTASSGLLLPEKTDGCPSEHTEAKTQRRRPSTRLGKAIFWALKKAVTSLKKKTVYSISSGVTVFTWNSMVYLRRGKTKVLPVPRSSTET